MEGIPNDIMPEAFGSVVMFTTNMEATMEYRTEAVDTGSLAEKLCAIVFLWREQWRTFYTLNSVSTDLQTDCTVAN